MERREPESKTLVARMACGDRGYSTAPTSHTDRGVMYANTEQTVVEENDVYTVHATQTHKSELESVEKESKTDSQRSNYRGGLGKGPPTPRETNRDTVTTSVSVDASLTARASPIRNMIAEVVSLMVEIVTSPCLQQ